MLLLQCIYKPMYIICATLLAYSPCLQCIIKHKNRNMLMHEWMNLEKGEKLTPEMSYSLYKREQLKV